MKPVESLQNPTLKWIRKVCADPRKEGFIVFEGEHTFEEALRSDFYFQAILMTRAKVDKWMERLGDYEVIMVDDDIFGSVSLNKSPEGVMAVGKMERRILREPSAGAAYLYLDEVQDPVNVGILVRSAHAFSYDGVFAGKGSADPFNPAALARSAGAAFHIPVYEMSPDNFLLWAKGNGVRVIVADASGRDLSEAEKPGGPFAVVVGNEGRGVRREIRFAADTTVSVKMREGFDSLNVSSAGSIMMYELKKGKM
ncbi:MAG TPA: RNA methyltransferase [Acidobacteriota bacterium]|nr:RNA methyltransferase [Acidobacteriota bacterium]HNT16849.1 RNA methyltransferase [Acidobacteriota bacterium]HQO19630.1 RNA methyltransferase [Acidobacteriota bacterium]HQQ46195.1 RNA methyltransferase [Acidobacteriota bacterium]